MGQQGQRTRSHKSFRGINGNLSLVHIHVNVPTRGASREATFEYIWAPPAPAECLYRAARYVFSATGVDRLMVTYNRQARPLQRRVCNTKMCEEI